MTFSGAGNTVVTGQLDGGGVLNIYGGAKPGGLIQSGAGTVTLNNTLDFAGDITVNTGAGPLNLLPTGGAYCLQRCFLRRRHDQRRLLRHLVVERGLDLQRHPEHAATRHSAVCSRGRTHQHLCGPISGGGSLLQNGPGTTVLSITTTITGSTTISSGVLQANIGVGIPATSFLTLDGGVLQSDGAQSRQLHAQPGHFRRQL